jgi:hypothetical protein
MIREGFHRADLHIINKAEDLKSFINLVPAHHTNLLMMSFRQFREYHYG